MCKYNSGSKCGIIDIGVDKEGRERERARERERERECVIDVKDDALT